MVGAAILGALSGLYDKFLMNPDGLAMDKMSVQSWYSVKALVTDKTCAIILEPLQGEGGINLATEEFMKGIRKLCDDEGILMICDRLQWVCLNGFQVRKGAMPDGTNKQQNKILDMLREAPEYTSTTTNLFKALIDRDYVQFRYLVE